MYIFLIVITVKTSFHYISQLLKQGNSIEQYFFVLIIYLRNCKV